MHLKKSSAKWRLFRLGLNELSQVPVALVYPREILLTVKPLFTGVLADQYINQAFSQ